MVHWWALREHRSSKKNLTPRRGIGCQVMMSGPLPGGLSVKGKCGQAGTHSSGWVEGLWARDCLSPAVLSHGFQSTDGPSAAHIWTSCNSGYRGQDGAAKREKLPLHPAHLSAWLLLPSQPLEVHDQRQGDSREPAQALVSRHGIHGDLLERPQ
ncbi:SLP adapter and CSK-interacting membrane protein isoform 4-T5 [Dama dama]|uniref:SLP adapter and CSK-interacting membrane protein isoform X4 n=1 Tax=Dama dama TaxID=30532 RepID=UPI002A36C6D6|nr:SLP adapter and CSK-interacting membrane protein isoform X4 [Dama dama]